MIVVLMGVTGAGKTTVGSLLAKRLGWEFADADSFHPPANVEKIRKGVPLDDADRAPWLQAMRAAIERWDTEKQSVVLACSALKKTYRRQLDIGPQVRFVYLKGSYDLIRHRLLQRHDHFADERILAGQFADLEEPEEAITVDIGPSAEEIVTEIQRRLATGQDRVARGT